MADTWCGCGCAAENPCGSVLRAGPSSFLYGVIATRQEFSSFGRVYAAYGGVFIVMSLLWGWWVARGGTSREGLDWGGNLSRRSRRDAVGIEVSLGSQ